MSGKLSEASKIRLKDQIRNLVVEAIRWYQLDEDTLSAMTDDEVRKTILDWCAMMRWLPSPDVTPEDREVQQ